MEKITVINYLIVLKIGKLKGVTLERSTTVQLANLIIKNSIHLLKETRNN